MDSAEKETLAEIAVLGFAVFLLVLLLLAYNRPPRCAVCGLEIHEGDNVVKVERLSRYNGNQRLLICGHCFKNLNKINEQIQFPIPTKDANEQP